MLSPIEEEVLIECLKQTELYLIDNKMFAYADYVKQAYELIEKDEKELGKILQTISIINKNIAIAYDHLNTSNKYFGFIFGTEEESKDD